MQDCRALAITRAQRVGVTSGIPEEGGSRMTAGGDPQIITEFVNSSRQRILHELELAH